MKEQIKRIEEILGAKAMQPVRLQNGGVAANVHLEKLADTVPGVSEWMSRLGHKTLNRGQAETAFGRMECLISKHMYEKGMSVLVDIDLEHGSCTIRVPRWHDKDVSKTDQVFRVIGPCSRHETSGYEHFAFSIAQVSDAIPEVARYLRDSEQLPISEVVAGVVQRVEDSLENKGLETLDVSCDIWFEDGAFRGGVILRGTI